MKNQCTNIVAATACAFLASFAAAADQTPVSTAPAPADTLSPSQPPAASTVQGEPLDPKASAYVRREGDEFTMRVSYNKEPGYRIVGIDVDTLVLVTLKDGTQALGVTVAFISNFDLIPDGKELEKVLAMNSEERTAYLGALAPQVRDTFESMLGLPTAQREMILMASKNMTTDPKQVSFMLQHVKVAHGISYDDIKNAGEFAKNYFPVLKSNLTPEQIKNMQIVVLPVPEEKKPASEDKTKKQDNIEQTAPANTEAKPAP